MMQRTGARILAARLLVAVVLFGGCSSATSPTDSPAPTPTQVAPTASASAAAPSTPAIEDRAAADLDRLDRFVRSTHVSPFTIHSESEWVAKLADVRAKLATAANGDERLALLASVVALLDTHTWIWRESGFREYPVYLYHFTEGWFVIAAMDSQLVGAKLVSIGGHPADEVETKLRELVPFDNEDGFLLNGQPLFSNADYLHGAGIVGDPASPDYVFELSDGSIGAPDMGVVSEQEWGDSLKLTGTLVGSAPEAVRRHLELSWSRQERGRVLLIAVNDYGDETAVIKALKDGLDSGTVKRVVVDMRYLPGGSGDFALLDAIKSDPRVTRGGVLTVLIGRENFSVATAIVREFDTNTDAVLVGEPTPARADNFRCGCSDLDLSAFGVTVSVPTWWDRLGDDRPEIAPDVEMLLSAEDFFAGRDPVLDSALSGVQAP